MIVIERMDHLKSSPVLETQPFGVQDLAADNYSLRFRARQVIRAAILTGALPPGSIHSAPALAAKLGVSATPVREAMLDLASSELVEPVRNRGFRINELSSGYFNELLEARLLIEVPAVTKATTRITPSDLDSCRQHLKQLGEAVRTRNVTDYLKYHWDFHLSLIGPCGNRHLVKLVGRLRDQTPQYQLLPFMESGGLDVVFQEHAALLDAVAGGDDGHAAQTMRAHITQARTHS